MVPQIIFVNAPKGNWTVRGKLAFARLLIGLSQSINSGVTSEFSSDPY